MRWLSSCTLNALPGLKSKPTLWSRLRLISTGHIISDAAPGHPRKGDELSCLGALPADLGVPTRPRVLPSTLTPMSSREMCKLLGYYRCTFGVPCELRAPAVERLCARRSINISRIVLWRHASLGRYGPNFHSVQQESCNLLAHSVWCCDEGLVPSSGTSFPAPAAVRGTVCWVYVRGRQRQPHHRWLLHTDLELFLGHFLLHSLGDTDLLEEGGLLQGPLSLSPARSRSRRWGALAFSARPISYEMPTWWLKM